MTGPPVINAIPPSVEARRASDERAIGRLLVTVTYVAVALLVVGVAAMAVAGIDPLDPPPALDPSTFVASVLALEPVAILWLGLTVVIITPIVRVIAAAIAYARGGEQRMVIVSIAILVVIAIGVVSALVTQVPA